jgi:flagellar biogenesis protein FliO
MALTWMPFALVVGGLILAGIIAVRVAPLLAQKGRTDRLLKHLGTLSLTPQCSVALVRVGRETLVLGVTPQSVSLLARAPLETPLIEAALADTTPEPASRNDRGNDEMAASINGAART